MKIITRESTAAEAAERWKGQYSRGGQWGTVYIGEPRDTREIYEALVALGPSPDPDAVNELIGNTSWASPPQCDECNKAAECIVQLGEEPDYESSTANICPDCLSKAIALTQPSLSPAPSA